MTSFLLKRAPAKYEMIQCPLCNAQQKYLEPIDTLGLIRLWENSGISVNRLFGANEVVKCKCNHCGLGFYYPYILGDDGFYGELSEWEWYYKYSGKTEYPFVGKMIKGGQSVIDVGSGIGEFAEYMPDGAKYIGIELSSKAVDIANHLGRDVRRMSIININNQYFDRFDIVTCFQVLEHIEDIHVFFSSLIKLCKPGGAVAIAVPNNDGFIGKAVNNFLNMPPHHVLLWNRTSLEYLANKYELIIEQYLEEPLQSVHFRWAHNVVLIRAIYSALNRKIKPVDSAIFIRIMSRLVSILSRVTTLLLPSLAQGGHSSIIILRKPIRQE